MQKIPLHLAAEGMVLARDVSRNDSSSNIPVCGKDTVLTNDLIRRFDLMDVKTVYVQGRPIFVEGEPTLDKMLADIEHRFVKVRNDPLMNKVYDIYTTYIKRTMGDEGGKQA